VRRRVFQRRKGAEDVDAERAFDLGQGQLVDGADGEDPGIRQGDVEPTEPVGGGGQGTLDGCLLGDVQRLALRVVACLAQRRCRDLDGAGVNVG
jgi:hypothetical protein